MRALLRRGTDVVFVVESRTPWGPDMGQETIMILNRLSLLATTLYTVVLSCSVVLVMFSLFDAI